MYPKGNYSGSLDECAAYGGQFLGEVPQALRPQKKANLNHDEKKSEAPQELKPSKNSPPFLGTCTQLSVLYSVEAHRW